jgi:hypothetical protein
MLLNLQHLPLTNELDWNATSVHMLRPTWYGNPAFLDPPPWFWLVIDEIYLARLLAFDRTICLLYTLNIYFYKQ